MVRPSIVIGHRTVRQDSIGHQHSWSDHAAQHAQGGKAQRLPHFPNSEHTPVMPDYRRNRVPGGTFFFTANLLDRRSDLLVTQIDALRDAVRQVRARAPFHIDACGSVLPDRMHCLWTPASAGAGYCRKAMPISRAVGARSRKGFRNPYASVNRSPAARRRRSKRRSDRRRNRQSRRARPRRPPPRPAADPRPRDGGLAEGVTLFVVHRL